MSEVKNLWQRINAVKAEVGYVKKGGEIEVMGNKKIPVVTHDDVAQLLQGAMVKHGVISKTTLIEYRFETFEVVSYGKTKTVLRLIGDFNVVLINVDKPEERETYRAIGISDNSGDKGPGIVTSYATKTVHLKAFGLVTGVDDEQSFFEKAAKKLGADVGDGALISKDALEIEANRLKAEGLAPGRTLKGIAALMGFGEARNIPAVKLTQVKAHVTRQINAKVKK